MRFQIKISYLPSRAIRCAPEVSVKIASLLQTAQDTSQSKIHFRIRQTKFAQPVFAKPEYLRRTMHIPF